MGMEAQLIFDIRITIILIVVYLTRSKTNYKKRMVFLLGYFFTITRIIIPTGPARIIDTKVAEFIAVIFRFVN